MLNRTHPDDSLPELGEQWRTDVVLKRDVFSTIERGFYKTYDQSEIVERPAILRRIDQVPVWSRLLARHFLKREARALAAAGEFGIAPRLLYSGKRVLVRSWIDGLPLHIARPEGDCGFFRSAKRALLLLHRAGFTHNDLAKEQNWLRTRDGEAALTDFQLATFFRRKTRLYRIAAYEDIRHLLKHKRRYAPDALTASERRILARKSWITRIWMATGKQVYYWITRGLLNFTDREGGGRRLVNDAPRIAARLKQHPLVRDVAIVAYPDRRTGTGLYAFVESQGFSEAVLSAYLAGLKDVSPPERLQLVDALPRDKAGLVRIEILQLVALNQVDLIDPLVTDEISRSVVSKIIGGRQNLRDRFAY